MNRRSEPRVALLLPALLSAFLATASSGYAQGVPGNPIGSQTGAQVVTLAPSVGGEKEVTDYFKLFDYDIAKLTAAIKAAGAK